MPAMMQALHLGVSWSGCALVQKYCTLSALLRTPHSAQTLFGAAGELGALGVREHAFTVCAPR